MGTVRVGSWVWVLVAGAAGCGIFDFGKGDSTTDTPTGPVADVDTDTDTDTDADADTHHPHDTGTPFTDYATGDTASSSALDVVAIGFAYSGGWEQSPAGLESVLFSQGGYFYELAPLVHVTLANDPYFDPNGADDPDNYCDFYATFDGHPSAAVDGVAFDWAAGTGSDGDLPDLGAGFEGTLELPPTFDNTRCYELDPGVFPGGTPTALMEGMRFGVGFGPLSPYLAGLFSGTGLDPSGLLTSYVAINHPDGAGGTVFTAYDWDYALYVRTDYGSCYYGLCGLVDVDPYGYFVLGDVHDQPLRGYVQAEAYWFEDLVNLDLSLLQ